MSLSPWDEGSDSDHATGLTWDLWLAGHHKIPAWATGQATTLQA